MSTTLATRAAAAAASLLLGSAVLFGCESASEAPDSSFGDYEQPDASNEPPPSSDTRVFANTARELYAIHPDTLTPTKMASFIWPAGSMDEVMTDIAIDKGGAMYGVSRTAFYAINWHNGILDKIAALDPAHAVDALAFVPQEAPGDGEVLVGASEDGAFWNINPFTGETSFVGEYGHGYISSGDLVYVDGLGVLATVNDGYESLAKIDTKTGAATAVGHHLEYNPVLGLGHWNHRLYGFTEWGQIVEIDPMTGSSKKLQEMSQFTWNGAAVLRDAPMPGE